MVCSPALFIYFLWRIFISGKSNESWRQNLGALPRLADRGGRKLVWIHAVSVGETVASFPVEEEIKRLMPDVIILHTTITQTGHDVARKSAKSADATAYFPFDFLFSVNRALDRVRPDVFVMIDTEIWPNFLSEAHSRGVKTVLANGRISDKTIKSSKRWPSLLKWATSNIDQCLMQTDEDGFRIISLGARPNSVHIVGSTKFDQDGGQLPPADVIALRADLGIPDSSRVLVAGSTNPGEDEPVLDAFRILRNTSDGAREMRLVIAPRQLDRAEEICSLAQSRGLTCARRSMKESVTPGGYDVLILDTFGELASVYAAGEIAFVGGSLIPKGGHSIVQPILQGKPVLFGPYTHKTRDVAQMALSAGVGFEVRDAAEFASRAESLLSDRDLLAQIDAACRELVARNRGASTRCAEAIVKLLEPDHGRE